MTDPLPRLQLTHIHAHTPMRTHETVFHKRGDAYQVTFDSVKCFGEWKGHGYRKQPFPSLYHANHCLTESCYSKLLMLYPAIQYVAPTVPL